MKSSTFSLRAKLIGAFLVPTLLIVTLYGALTYFASRQGLEDELGKRLTGIAQVVAATMSDGVDAQQLARLDESKTRVRQRIGEKLNAVREATGVRRIFVFDAEKSSLVDTDPNVVFGEKLYALEADEVELSRTFSQKASTTSVLFKGRDDQLYKAGYAPITVEGEVVAVVGVEGSAEYFELLRYLASVLTFLGGLGLILVVLVGTIVSRRITHPLHVLVAAARRLGQGHYDQAIIADPGPDGPSSNDELRFLAEAFEEMRQDIVSRDHQMQMMLSGIAHEVRNPLGGMKLFVGLLEEDLKDKGGLEDELEKVVRIEKELVYLDRVVTDFLDFAREQPLATERFRATEFLAELDDMLGPECKDCGASLNVDVLPLDLELTGDRGKLRRAVINCVRNAHQACGEGGAVTVAISGDGDSRRIEVRDNGPGIPAEKLDQVLTPFFTTKEKGSGLGLSLTRRIIEEHGGRMVVESEAGRGTTIVFELPFDASLESSGPDIPEGWLG